MKIDYPFYQIRDCSFLQLLSGFLQHACMKARPSVIAVHFSLFLEIWLVEKLLQWYHLRKLKTLMSLTLWLTVFSFLLLLQHRSTLHPLHPRSHIFLDARPWIFSTNDEPETDNTKDNRHFSNFLFQFHSIPCVWCGVDRVICVVLPFWFGIKWERVRSSSCLESFEFWNLVFCCRSNYNQEFVLV